MVCDFICCQLIKALMVCGVIFFNFILSLYNGMSVDKPTKLSMKLNIKESTKIEEKKNI
jgi:hypothetical protein